MSDKLVHVSSYTRDDGTKVKEHYRGGDSNVENDGAEQTPLLVGGVSEYVYYPEEKSFLEKYSDAIEVVLSVAQMAGTIAQEGLRIASQLRTADKASSTELGAKMEEVVDKMRETQSLSVSTEQATLEKLSNTTNQREYKELYDTYVQQRELNRASEAVINRIAYSAEHKNYEDVVSGLKEYNTLHTQSAQSVMERANLNSQPNTLQFEEPALPESHPSISENMGNLVKNTVVPQMEKQILGGAFNIAGTFAQDANMFWKVATDDVRGYKDYVEQNGYFVDSIGDLPFDFKDTVRAKVKQQLGVDDLRGLVLRPDSSLAQDIISSSEYQNFILKSMHKLQRGEVVSGSVGYPFKTLNLGSALGRADILDTYINKNGDIVSFVLDTYDFNKGERWLVKIARDVQEHGLLNGFYSITILLVSKEQWLSWLIK